MNRAERRRQQKESHKKEATYTITESKLNSIIEEKLRDFRQKMVNQTSFLVTESFLVYAYVVLHDKFGFDKEGLMQFKEAIDSLADGVTGDYCTNVDLLDLCINEFGLDIDPDFYAMVKEGYRSYEK